MQCLDFISKWLKDQRIRAVFSKKENAPQISGLRMIRTTSDQGALIAAEGYARISGTFGTVFLNDPDAVSGAMTGIIGSWLDSIPLIILSVPQNTPDLLRPVTKEMISVQQTNDLLHALQRARFIACDGRKGPVFLSITESVLSGSLDPEKLKGFTPPEKKRSADLDKIPEIIHFLQHAKSPAVIAGHGIRLDHAETEFESLIRQLNIPVLSTFEAMDQLPSDDPLRIGAFGTIGTRGGNIVLQNADFILCLGSRNNIRQTSYNYEKYAVKAERFVAVDIDENELNKPTFRPSFPVHAGVREFLSALLHQLPETLTAPAKWLQWCQERRDAYDPVLPEYQNAPDGLNPYYFTRYLTDLLPENSVIACANATPSLTLFQGGTIKKGERMFCNSGCAAMGFGFPAAIGTAAAAPDSTLVCLDGDGSLMMSLRELITPVREKLPVKLFLFSNGEYTSIRQTQDNFFARRTGCDALSGVTFPDWSGIASAFGIRYEKIDSIKKMKRVLPEILKTNEFVFCEVVLTPGYSFAPKLSSRHLPDGTLVSPSLEDMSPFLSEEEQKKNVYCS